MRFKLSVRELEILDKDRIKILKKLRESHLNDTSRKQSKSSTKKPMKPPILVVPLDDSRLFCIIQTCSDYDDPIENDEKDAEQDMEKVPSTKKCCKGSIRRKTARHGLMKDKVENRNDTTIEEHCHTNEIETTTQNVPKKYDQIFSASVDAHEVYK